MKNFLKIAIITLMFFFGFNPVFASGVKFIQFTDVHYSISPENTQQLKTAIKYVNNIPNVDFVVFTGDNIENPSVNDLIGFLKIIKELKVPYYVMLGNHDVFKAQGLSKLTYMTAVKKYVKCNKTTNPNFMFKQNEIVFVALDGTKEVLPSSSGYFKPAVLTYLDKVLTENDDKKVVIFQHFPLIIQSEGSNHNTYDVESYNKVLSKHDNVLAVIAGHYHLNDEKMVNGIYNVVTPSFGKSTAPLFKLIDVEASKNKLTGQNEYAVYTQLLSAPN